MKIVNKYENKDYVRVGEWGRPDFYECRQCKHRCKEYSGIRAHISRRHSQ